MKSRLVLVVLVVLLTVALATPALAAGQARVIQPGGQPLSALYHPARVTDVGAADTIFADNFEAGMSPLWMYWSPSGPCWAPTTYTAAEGTHSAYCVGSAIPAPGPYPSDTDSWMAVGPFDLSQYTEGTIHCWVKWSFDALGTLYILDSFDGSNWNGLYTNTPSNPWDTLDFSLNEIANQDGGYGVLGRSQVWFAFVVRANGGTGEGAYIDDVRITAPDTAAPTGTLQINGGQAYTGNPAVTLALDSPDGATQMQFRNEDGVWGGWEAFAASKSWTLSGGDGAKTVSVRYKDAAGNVSSDISASIGLDTVKPVPAAYAASVLRYHRAYLKFKVVDPSCARARVTIKVRNSAGTVVKTLGPKTYPTGVLKSTYFTCKLKKGTYKFYVYATDLAGNAQLKPAVNRLVVK